MHLPRSSLSFGAPGEWPGDLGGSQASATCAGATGAGLADRLAEEPPAGSSG